MKLVLTMALVCFVSFSQVEQFHSNRVIISEKNGSHIEHQEIVGTAPNFPYDQLLNNVGQKVLIAVNTGLLIFNPPLDERCALTTSKGEAAIGAISKSYCAYNKPQIFF